MAGVVIDIVLRYCDIVFGECNYTKNRGACVHGIIWLVVFMISQINLFTDQANQLIYC